MELFVKAADRKLLFEKMCSVLAETGNRYWLEEADEAAHIFCDRLDLEILSDEDMDLDCIRQDFKADINMDLWIEIYDRSYDDGIRILIKILERLLGDGETDMILLDEQSRLIFSRVKQQIYMDKSYPHFPFRDLEDALH